MHLRRTALTLGLAVAASLALGACGGGTTAATGTQGSQGGGRIAVVASTDVYGSIAEAIGGDDVAVHSIINSAAADPHSYEATAQDKLAVSKAAVGIENGGGYDDFFGRLASGVLDPAKVVNVSELSGLDKGADFNEHVWYSLPTMAKLADELAERFSSLDTVRAATFKANASAFKGRLDGLEGKLAALKSAHPGATAAITEPVPVYLLQAAGLANKTPAAFSTAIENGSDVPTTVLRDTVALMASGTVDLLAYNEQTEGPQTLEVKKAAQAAGVPVVDFSETLPAGDSYLEWMAANTAHLTGALDHAKATAP
ncbi:metal ABC transporter solute-binding protein, Zn/Mn family [Arthrobacter sp. SDTb3-6]|uniref:metal ABC transporter solute-binding protein, Zn/Mn family n=1 Tax=Arthrobacter sp. SDTb3-6 TaxID=2713571 RepID=UPI00159DF319|nr:zinc ABC transporter substrate-binding protein [Arthrobacter sp. SDTb3-6]NVM98819.1 zinc ABC transporter solute-binding protein [Arthrobacter sp. SDTb3-6]